MKIMVIIPNSSYDFTQTQIAKRKAAEENGIQIDVTCLERGPVSIESSYDEVMAAPYLLETVQKAEQDGYDGISIDCAADPSMRAVKELVNIPVVSAGESSYLYAMVLCNRFSVIAVLPNTAKVINDNINKYCLRERVASVRSANVPVLDLEDEARAFAAIKSEAEKAIREDGAEAIVLGCTGMSSLALRLQNELSIPVVDPAISAIYMLVSLIKMNKCQSRLSYLSPPDKPAPAVTPLRSITDVSPLV